MKCTACEKELKRTELLYTEDKLPYCINPFTCNDNHPNSVKNIVARGGAVQMFTEEELDNNIFETLNVSPEMKERIIKLVAKPQSIRLSKYDNAYYLLKLMETTDIESVGEAVRHCIQVAMNYEPVDAAQEELPVPEPVPTPPVQEPEQGMVIGQSRTGSTKGVKYVSANPQKPSINVDWDEIDRQRKIEAEAEKETVPEVEEDEFAF